MVLWWVGGWCVGEWVDGLMASGFGGWVVCW